MNQRKKTAPKAAKPEDATINLAQLQLLTVLEVAKLLSIGRSTTYVLINKGELQSVRLGNVGIRVLAVSVQQYIVRNMQAS